MKHCLLLLACKDTPFLLDTAGWIINIVDIFNVDWINQWYLSKIEASRHVIYFKVIHPNKYFQIYSREKWASNDQISKKHLETTCKNSWSKMQRQAYGIFLKRIT